MTKENAINFKTYNALNKMMNIQDRIYQTLNYRPKTGESTNKRRLCIHWYSLPLRSKDNHPYFLLISPISKPIVDLSVLYYCISLSNSEMVFCSGIPFWIYYYFFFSKKRLFVLILAKIFMARLIIDEYCS